MQRLLCLNNALCVVVVGDGGGAVDGGVGGAVDGSVGGAVGGLLLTRAC